MALADAPRAKRPFTDPEAERRAIAAAVMIPNAWPEIAPMWDVSLFSDPLCRRVAEAVDTIMAEDGTPSPTRVLRKMGGVQAAANDLLLMADAVLSPSEAAGLYRHLRGLWLKRSADEALRGALESLRSDPDMPAEEAVARAEQLLLSGFQRAEATQAHAWDDVQAETYQRWVERISTKSESGIPTGLTALNRATRGLRRQHLIIVAGRPSMGKSAIVGQMIRWQAKVRRVRSLVFSLEQTRHEWVERAFWHEGQIDAELWESPGEREPEIRDKVARAMSSLQGLPIRIVDKRGLTVQEIGLLARTEKLRYPDLQVIVVDHLQLIRPHRSRDSYVRILGEIVSELRNIAGDLDVAMVVLSQLNRGVESRENKRPLLSDLRDSGEIEQDADQVIGLYRDDYYNPQKAQQDGLTGFTEIITLKGRQTGAGRTALVRFLPGRTAWEDLPDSEVIRYTNKRGGEMR